MELTDFITLALVVVVILGVSLALHWRHVLQPLQGAVETAIPLLVDLCKMLPGTFATQRDMIAQSQEQAISLKDAINLLDDAAERARWRDERNQEAGETLKMALHGDRVLAQQDRDQLAKLIMLLDRLAVERAQIATDLAAREEKVDAATSGVAHDLTVREAQVDAASSGVASDLAERQRIIDKLSSGVALDLTERQRLIDLASAGVASDLVESQRRADDTSGPPGTAADAAVQSPSPEAGDPHA